MAQPPVDHACVKTTEPKAAAAAKIGAPLARRKRAELLETATAVLRADRAVAAGRQVRRRGDKPEPQAQRVDDRRACRGPDAG